MFSIGADHVHDILDDLPIEKLFGVGPKTYRRACGGNSQLRRFAPGRRCSVVAGLRQARKDHARTRIAAWTIGRGPNREEQSISAEETFAPISAGLPRSRCNCCGSRMGDLAAAGAKLAAGRVSVKIRRADFTTYTRQRALKPPTQDSGVVSAAAKTLLEQWLATQPNAAVRLLGVGVSDLQMSVQADLFGSNPAEGSRLDAAVDGIRGRFGTNILTRASYCPEPERLRIRRLSCYPSAMYLRFFGLNESPSPSRPTRAISI